MRALRQAFHVACLEVSVLRRLPHLGRLALGIVLIPALYAFIYLESVWEPDSRTPDLPALIVNQDQGTDAGGQRVNIGAQLTESLREKATFGYREEPDLQAARMAVRRGDSLFALIIPPDFSANAMSAQSPGAGRLVVFASEGNNYAGAGFAKRFAAELGHEVNETLAAQRWRAVLGAAATSSDSLHQLREGAGRLREGAIALDDALARAHGGSAQLAEGTARLASQLPPLAEGLRQAGAGARALDARRPAASDLQALKSGASQLAAGHMQWRQSMGPLEEGASRLQEGALRLGEEVQAVPFFGAQLAAGAGQLGQGAGQLQAGLRTANEIQAKLAAGSQSVAAGTGQVVDGFNAYTAAVSTLASRLPADAALEELTAGGHKAAQAGVQLRDGLDRLRAAASQLAMGMDTLARSLPDGLEGPAGTPEGLAVSVQPRLEIDAPVRHEGMGLAPSFIPVALWLGAAMVAFVVPLRQVPLGAQGSSPLALTLGKLGVAGSLNVAQALAVLLMSCLLLDLQPVHAMGLAITMVTSSLTFMLVVLLLVRALGDVGKGISVLLLVLQLSSAGGVMPVELTSDFYRFISPWMPFTWSVKAVRASAFGAFDGQWARANGVMLLFALGAFALSVMVRRWRFVPDEAYQPALDV